MCLRKFFNLKKQYETVGVEENFPSRKNIIKNSMSEKFFQVEKNENLPIWRNIIRTLVLENIFQVGKVVSNI